MPTVPTDNNAPPRDFQKLPPERDTSLQGLKGWNQDDVRPPAQASEDVPQQKSVEDFKAWADDGAAPQPSVEDFKKWADGTEEKAAKLETTVSFAADKSEAEAQRILRLQKTSGLGEAFVEQNASQIEKYEKISAFDAPSFARTSPIIAEWMAESPTRTAATWRDLPALRNAERMVKDHVSDTSLYDLIDAGIMSLSAGIRRVPGFVVDYANYPMNQVAKVMNDLGLNLVPQEEGKPNYMASMGDNEGSKWLDAKAKEIAPEIQGDAIEEIKQGEYSRAGKILFAQVVHNAPTQLLPIMGTLVGGPVGGAIGLGMMGTLTAANKNAELQERTDVAPDQKIQASVNHGIIEAAMERVGTLGILKSWENAIARQWGKQVSREVFKDFGKTLLYSVFGEGNEEALTSLAQDLSDVVTGINPDALQGSMQRAGNAALVGGLSGGGLTAPGGIAGGIARQAQVRETKRIKDFYVALGQTWEGMEIGQKVPGIRGEIVKRLTKDGPLEHLYISTEALKNYFEARGDNATAVMQSLGQLPAYETALQTGEDVKIPLSVWAEHFVGSEHWQGLADDIKLNQSTPSVNERKALDEEEKKRVEEAAKAAEGPVDPLRGAIDEHLKALNFDETTRDQYAVTTEGRIRARAKTLGIDPLQLWEQEKVTIRAGATPNDPNALQQKALPKGYKLGIEGTPEYGNSFTVYVRDKKGSQIGYAGFFYGDGGLVAEDVQVTPNFRRKGVATAMYDFASRKAGADIRPSENLSDDAKAFWRARDRVLKQENLPAVKGQTLPAVQPTLSPLGLYSQLEAEVLKMDFKSIPAKDLAGRIKNIQGLKSEELELSGVFDWLATKTELSATPFVVTYSTEEGGDFRAERFAKEEDAKAAVAEYQGKVAEASGIIEKWGGYSKLLEAVGKDDPNAQRDRLQYNNIGVVSGADAALTTDTNSGKVTREELLDFIRGKTVKVGQVQYASDYERDDDDDDGDGPSITAADLSWDEGEIQEPDSDSVSQEAEYYTESLDNMENSFDDYEEQYTSHAKELIEEDESIPEEYFVKGENGELDVKKTLEKFNADELKKFDKKMEELLAEHYSDAAWGRAREYLSSQDNEYAEWEYTERETGWRLRGSSGHGSWWSPELREHFEGSVEEAQVQLIPHMIARGVIGGSLADAFTAEDVSFGSPFAIRKAGTTYAKMANDHDERQSPKLVSLTNEIEAAEHEALYREAFEFYDWKEGADREEAAKNRVKELARKKALEKLSSFDDPTNDVSTVVNVGGVLMGVLRRADGEFFYRPHPEAGFRALGPISYPEATQKVYEILREIKAIAKEEEAQPETPPEAPAETPKQKLADVVTGRAKWTSYLEDGWKRALEILLTAPFKERYRSPHFGEVDNVLVHIRATERKTSDGKDVFVADEIQSDPQQDAQKYGVRGSDAVRDEIAELTDKIDDAKERFEATANPPGDEPETHEAREERGKRMKAISREQSRLEARLQDVVDNTVPAAPFTASEAWMTLAIKRMFIQAMEMAQDAVAWFPAETHLQRWGTQAVMWKKAEPLTDPGEWSVFRNAGGEQYSIYSKYGGRFLEAPNFNNKEDAQSWLENRKKPGWFVATHGAMKGNLSDSEEDKKFRADYAETRGVRVSSLEDLEDKILGLHDQTTAGDKYKLAAKIWERMQSEDSGSVMPRKNGYEFEYNQQIPKIVKKLIGKLDKNAKIEVMEVDGHKVLGVVLTDKMKQGLTAGLPLFQDSRGSYDRVKRAMTLGSGADLSTYLHESGHVWLDEMARDYAYLKNNNQTGVFTPEQQQFIRDAEATLSWLGVKNFSEIQTKHHEKWAKGVEKYFLEGVAPSASLRDAMARFAVWLTDLYKEIREQYFKGIEINPEIRGVMDRLLATQEEIQAAQSEQNRLALFPELAADVQAMNTEATLLLTEKVLLQQERERSKKQRERRAEIRAEVEKEINARPEYIALSVLQTGKLPDGSKLPKSGTGGFAKGNLSAIKLNKAELLDIIGPDRFKALPKPYIYSAKGGVTPDAAAMMFGYGSVDEMIQAFEKAPDRVKLIEQETDQRLWDETPNMMTNGQLQVEAMKAIHNDKRAQILEKELLLLHQKKAATFRELGRRASRPLPTAKGVRIHAQNLILAKTIREINPFSYQRAEAKSAKEAMELFLKGDIEGAFAAKERELLNHELYRAATQAREDVDAKVEAARSFEKTAVQERLGKAGGDYLEQILALLERFDFRQASLRAIDKRKSLLKWVEAQKEEGFPVDVPEKVLNEAYRTHYKDLTYGDLVDVMDTVTQIAHLAAFKNELLAKQAARNMEEAEDLLTGTLQAHHKMDGKIEDISPGLKDKIVGGLKEGIAEHTRMEFLFEYLDGGKANGPFWQMMFRPFAEAEAKEIEMAKRDKEALDQIFEKYSPKERRLWYTQKKFIEGAVVPDKFNGNITKAQAMAIALNWGNEHNRTAIMEGWGWSEQQVNLILDTMLDAKDIQTVNQIWKHLDSYWGEIAKLEREMTGVVPEKVQGTAYTLKSGVLEGGYYPLKFDHERSYRQWQLDESAALGEKFGTAMRAHTKHGHTIERTNSGGKPPLLELSVISRHLGQVRHDLTHRRAVIDVSRLVNRPKIREGVERAVGKQMYRQLNPWLKGIAGDTPVESFGQWEKFLGRMRGGATVVNLGLKVTSGIVQTLGYLSVIDELGVRYAASGMTTLLKNPLAPFQRGKEWDFIAERSTMMRERLENFDRDVRDELRSGKASGVEASWFYLIGMMDLALSIPGWKGAYQKAMDGKIENIKKDERGVVDEKEAIEYADSVIRKSMAAGGAKDLAMVQRGGEMKKLFTSFYSQLSIAFNLLARMGRRVGMDGDYPKLLASLMLLWFLPAVLPDLLRGRGPDKDEEWWQWALMKIGLFPLNTIVGLRDFASFIEWRHETGRKAAFTGSPAFQAAAEIGNAGYALASKTFGEEEFTRQDVKSIVMAAGYLAKLPTRQLWLTGEYFTDYLTGEYQPEEDWRLLWEGLVTGKPRE